MKTNRGFTLIELLMVAAILSLLLSMVFFRVTEARKKGEDAHMRTESAEVAKASYLYKDENGGFMPGALNVSVPRGQALLEGTPEYEAAMSELVPDYLSEIPHSPGGSDYSYVISSDGTEAVFAADLNYTYSNENDESWWNSCPLTEDDEEGGEPPCSEPTLPPDYVDVYGTSFDYVSGNYYSYPKLQVPYMQGTCDIAHNYDYGFYQLAGILEYGLYDCIDLPGGISQAQTICDLYQPLTGNACSGLSGPYYNGVSGVFIYHQYELDRVNSYLQQHLHPYDDAYAEYDQCMIDHADEYDEYGDFIGGGEGDEESESICDGLTDTDYCTCI